MADIDPTDAAAVAKHDIYGEQFKTRHNINPNFTITNDVDENENPTGGSVRSQGIIIDWQNGPRGQADGSLADPNGAFVEDVIYAALQRLAFFQTSKYAHEANAEAAGHLRDALDALEKRSSERAKSGKLGKHEV